MSEIAARSVGGDQVVLETEAPFASRADRAGVAVAADATLYRGAEAVMGSAASGILSGYERSGVGFLGRLDGDFAFVLWDTTSRRLLAARDFTGRRSLFYAFAGERLTVASTVAGVLRDERVPRTLDLAAITIAAAGLWGHSSTTAYAAVHELPPGHLLEWRPGAPPQVTTFWRPPERIMTRQPPLEGAAAELRELLVDAVRVRLAPVGTTAISLSGGWDSTAVLGAGVASLGPAAHERLRPVSISYPPDDPGREDDLIEEVARHTGVATRWIEVDSISLFEGVAERAAQRDLPFAHAFEAWNRRLARDARAAGASVILDGAGGDQLFQVSDIYLSDLFARGRWLELARQWKGRGGRGARNFWRWAVRPGLPTALTTLLARMRGMEPPPHHLDRQPPFWFVPRFLESHAVLVRERRAAPVLPGSSRVLAESHAYLRYAYFGRVLAQLHRFAREEGVESRSPLLDSRVVAFAAQRPWSERANGPETKLLLRRAMRGLLPDRVLAPRARRTGVTSAYFLRQLRGPGRAAVTEMLNDSRLADVGMIDLPRLRRAWEHVLAHDDDEMGIRIYFTLQAEFWLRSHEERAG